MKEELVNRGEALDAGMKVYSMLYDAFSKRKVDRKGRLEEPSAPDLKELGKKAAEIFNALPTRAAVKYEIKVRREDVEAVGHAMMMAGYKLCIDPVEGIIRWEVKA